MYFRNENISIDNVTYWSIKYYSAKIIVRINIVNVTKNNISITLLQN